MDRPMASQMMERRGVASSGAVRRSTSIGAFAQDYTNALNSKSFGMCIDRQRRDAPFGDFQSAGRASVARMDAMSQGRASRQ